MPQRRACQGALVHARAEPTPLTLLDHLEDNARRAARRRLANHALCCARVRRAASAGAHNDAGARQVHASAGALRACRRGPGRGCESVRLHAAPHLSPRAPRGRAPRARAAPILSILVMSACCGWILMSWAAAGALCGTRSAASARERRAARPHHRFNSSGKTARRRNPKNAGYVY
jgi:hypothetical protein